MKKSLIGNRLIEYDEKGTLVSERDATLEDLLDVLVSNYELSIELDIKTGKGQITIKRKTEQ
jgi:hypothetical protein